MYMCIVDVTPAMARAWLELNLGNRIIRPAQVAKYARALTRGTWRTTHQGVAFDTNGHLRDGQHRLSAIVLTGLSARIVVWRDVAPEVFDAVDRNLIRDISDILRKDRRVVDVAAALAKITAGSVIALEPDVGERIIEAFKDEIAFLPGKKQIKLLNTAPTRAAVVARMAAARDAGDEKTFFRILDSFGRFVAADQNMPALPYAFYQQLTKHGGAAREVFDLAARSWVAFDPRKAEINRLTVIEPSIHLAKIRAVVEARIPGLYAELRSLVSARSRQRERIIKAAPREEPEEREQTLGEVFNPKVVGRSLDEIFDGMSLRRGPATPI